MTSSSKQFFCPMVKSNAYGHGDIELTRVCEDVGVSGVGVALLEEGIRLRKAGISLDIFVFGPILDSAVTHLFDYQLTPVIGQWPELLAMEKLLGGREFSLHLKFNTGMNRLGFNPQESESLLSFFRKHPNLKLTGICTHLLQGDDIGKPESISDQQIQDFESIISYFSHFQPQVHLWNSSGWFAVQDLKTKYSQSFHWGVRPGISIYGIQPLENKFFQELKPVMSIVSEIVTIQKVRKGETVSYGGMWQASKESLIGVVPIGYADGYSRSFSNRGEMLIGGSRVPIRGIVCMDYTMVDLTDLNIDPGRDLGKEVILLGEQSDQKITAEELAEMIDTIPYEIITCIGQRVPREFKGH